MLDNAIRNLRNISHNLLPPGLEEFGLESTLQDVAQRIKTAGGPDVDVHYDLTGRLPIEQELHLYRIAQELLNNTLKHAEASNIRFGLNSDHRGVIFRYTDDGKGYDTSTSGSTGLGLKTISTRVEMLAANLEVSTRPNEGNAVTIYLPEP